MPRGSRSSPLAELETRAESWQPLLSERKACRWEPPFSRARSQERTLIIARLSSAARRSRQLLLVGSLEDLRAASRTGCSMNSTKKIQRSCLTHFNVHSCGTYRFRRRRQGDPNCFLSGRDRVPTYRGVQTCAHCSTRL